MVNLCNNALRGAEKVAYLKCAHIVDNIGNDDNQQNKNPLIVVVVVDETYFTREIGAGVLTIRKSIIIFKIKNLFPVIVDIFKFIRF